MPASGPSSTGAQTTPHQVCPDPQGSMMGPGVVVRLRVPAPRADEHLVQGANKPVLVQVPIVLLWPPDLPRCLVIHPEWLRVREARPCRRACSVRMYKGAGGPWYTVPPSKDDT